MNRNTTLVLVGIFGILVLYLIFVQRPQDEAALNATPTAAPGGPVWAITADQIINVRITAADGQQVAFQENAQGVWDITSPEAQSADQTQITTALGQVAGLTYSSALTPTADLSVFGLNPPAYTLEFTLADGTAKKALVGNKTPTNSGYYLVRDGETEILIVASFSLESLLGLVVAPPYFVPTPTITPTVDLISTLLAPTATPDPSAAGGTPVPTTLAPSPTP